MPVEDEYDQIITSNNIQDADHIYPITFPLNAPHNFQVIFESSRVLIANVNYKLLADFAN